MICKKCKVEKEDNDFSFKNKKLGKKHCVCKQCPRSYKIDYYNKNKESHYIRNNITKDKIKEYISEVKSGGCIKCNEKVECCLDFHHLDNKIEGVASLKNKGSLKKVKEEIAKCVVLCSNCHRKVHAKLLIL